MEFSPDAEVQDAGTVREEFIDLFRVYSIKAVHEALLSCTVQGNLGFLRCVAQVLPSCGVQKKQVYGKKRQLLAVCYSKRKIAGSQFQLFVHMESPVTSLV